MQENAKNIFSINQRIIQFIEYLGISRYKFSKETGISEVNILNIYKGKNKPSIDFIEKLLNIYKVLNPTWLLTGEGPMLINAGHSIVNEPMVEYNRITVKSDSVSQFPCKTVSPLSNASIPLYSVDAIAGVVEVYEQVSGNEPIAYIEIPNLPKCDGAIYVVGDSMYPLLKSGDIIIYKVLHNVQNIMWGEIYLLSIVHDGDAYITVKYVKQVAHPRWVTLISYNEHHQPNDFPIDAIRFAAQVKASIRFH